MRFHHEHHHHHHGDPDEVEARLRSVEHKLDLALAVLRDLHPNTGQLSPENQAKVDEIFAIEAADRNKIDAALSKK